MKIKFDMRRQAVQKLVWVLIFFSAANVACNYAPPAENKTAAPPVNAEPKQSAFESDLETMRTANFEYIFVFRRKDGGAFDGEDKKYLNANKPTTNRVLLTDEDKAVIAGSHYKFPPESLDVLRTRFNIEDYSPVKEEGK